jgi:hypothetical protein
LEREKTTTTDLSLIAPDLVQTTVSRLEFELGEVLAEFKFRINGGSIQNRHIPITDPAILDQIKAIVYGRTELEGHKETTIR